ncbi:MAG: MMPL family transporter, partial [Candidatus Pacearchaeota archaeon]|nr:MMPL family transporter [Candidatus Pacearchaeota archaeon]
MKKNSLINWYSKFVSNNAVLVLFICLLISVVMFVGMQLMQSDEMDYEDLLPQDYDVIKAFTLIEDEFGSTNAGIIVIEIDNSYVNSNEYKSVVEPEVVRYSLLLENYLLYLDNVESVNGFGSLIKEEYGKIPNNLNDIRGFARIYGGSYVSNDESMMLISVYFDEDIDAEKSTIEIYESINNVDKPAGVSVDISGDIFQDYIIDQEIGPDMNKTSMFSMIAIVVILFFIFRSVRGVVLPLMTIIFGVIWTMGFLGLIGSGISSMTSGAISMIMGIGIDFGIQV